MDGLIGAVWLYIVTYRISAEIKRPNLRGRTGCSWCWAPGMSLCVGSVNYTNVGEAQFALRQVVCMCRLCRLCEMSGAVGLSCLVSVAALLIPRVFCSGSATHQRC